jgi:LacI family transcriptional regulator
VASDAEGAGRLAAEHLIGLGHRRLAFVGPSSDVHGVRMRERGFIKALAAAGISMPSDRLRRVPPTLDGGQIAMRALLALPAAERPTGVFFGNDLLALGAHKACTQAGVSIPREMSLVGCDDIAFAQLVTPELTTVAVPARELGARAARLLVRSLERGSAEEEAASPTSIAPQSPNAAHVANGATRQRPLPVRLAVRGTTAAPRADEVPS